MKSGHDYNYFDILRSLKKIKVKKNAIIFVTSSLGLLGFLQKC